VATYTSLDDLDVAFLEERYGLAGLVIEPVKGGAANSSFKVTSDCSQYVLTVLDNHDHASALALAEQTGALYGAGYPTTHLVSDVDGDLVPLMGGRPVVLKDWVNGDVVETLHLEQLVTAGEHLARLHNLPPDLVVVPVGTRRLAPERLALIPGFTDQEFAAWLQDHLAQVREAERDVSRPRALCHGDLFADNIVVGADGLLTILDWETISLDDPLLDLGMTALGLCRTNGLLSVERLAALVSGYARLRSEVRDDLDQLATEIVHAALIIAFHRYYRHNVRFPDPTKATIHRELYAFVESVPANLALG
jgi:homoserine kinase type II